MGSDRARVTYDGTRQYRAVVAQQGRVTVEADLNEAWTIDGEEERETLLDVIGRAGTPDNGYAVTASGATAAPPFDFQVGAGTMYVGGVDSRLAADVTYSQQAEWLDTEGDPDWADPSKPAEDGKAFELILLELTEREVSATEDTALREVALGGPDTSQRLRLVQRIKRIGTDARTCAAAGDDAAARWSARGQAFDTDTMQLGSEARLQVSFQPPVAPDDPCDPDAAGGYLGAENQLIRVQLTEWDAASGAGRLLWGFDDASFLYRVDAVNAQLVQLRSRPPDDFHQPRAGQAIELLRSAVELTSSDFIAAASGQVFTLASPYVPDTQRVTLPAPGLDASFLDPAKTPQVFLRVWEEQLEFTAGTPVALGTTGIEVSLTADGGGPFHAGDFWLFAVRPATPTVVYPDRYLDAPQPPDGPRTWICPLAVVQFTNGGLDVIEDCRNPFDNLVDLTGRRGQGCCDLVLRPEDLRRRTLQQVIDALPNRREATICLMPGVYELPRPLVIGPDHSHLTLEGCHDGVVLRAADGHEKHFLQGLVVLIRADRVTLRNLRFHLPLVPLGEAGGKLGGLGAAESSKMLGTLLRELVVSIGLRPVHCAQLTIEDCLFRFSVTPNRDCFGVGVLAGSECWGLKLRENRFLRDEDYLRVDQRPFRLFVGYVLAPSAGVGGKGIARRVVPALLHDASIRDNLFDGLGAAALVIGKLGVIALEDNVVRSSNAGFLFLSLPWLGLTKVLPKVKVAASSLETATTVQDSLLSAVLDPVVQIAGAIARAYPLPDGFQPEKEVRFDAKRADAGEKRLARDLQGLFDRTLAAPRAANGRGAAGKAEETTTLEDRIAVVAPTFAAERGLGRFARLGAALVNVERAAFAALDEHGLHLSLRVAGNDVQAFVPDGPSSMALAVLDQLTDEGEATIVGNRFRNRSTSAPTAAAVMVPLCAVSGNLVLNDAVRGGSLVLLPAPGKDIRDSAAAAGNTFLGPPLLPPRSLPAPLDTWDVLNAEL